MYQKTAILGKTNISCENVAKNINLEHGFIIGSSCNFSSKMHLKREQACWAPPPPHRIGAKKSLGPESGSRFKADTGYN